MLGEHAEEAFDGTELRRMDHHRLFAGAVGCDVFESEALGLVEVELDGRHLPGAADGVAGLDGDLRAVEGGAARVGDQLEAGLLGDLLQDGRRLGPLLVGADELVLLLSVLVAGRDLQRHVGEAEVIEEAEHEPQQVADLVRGLLLRDVAVRVVLRDGTHAGESLHDARLLVAVHRAELEQPQRQVAIGPSTER